VPFLLVPDTQPAIGLLRPPIIAALCTDNVWRSANGYELAWDIPTSASSSSTDAPPPYIAFVPTLAQGSPATCTSALAKTLNHWCADANAREGISCKFAGVIGGKRWCAEWYNMYVVPNGVLHTDGCNPLTLLEVSPVTSTATMPKSGLLLTGRSGYAFSMEHHKCATCKLFSVAMYGVHMTMYEQQKGDTSLDGNGVWVWVPQHAVTEPTYVHHVYISPPSGCLFFFLLFMLSLIPTSLSFLLYDHYLL